ncbi:hypothetical protein WG936_05445 [Corynebacterium sp. H127]|uniref:hypothetical protein n=1 Tax=Corynebacterium sp. H127 TaxID=3133418 RepID=UPI0030A0AD5E
MTTMMSAQLASMPRSAIDAANARAKIIHRTLALLERIWGPRKPQDPAQWMEKNGQLFEFVLAQAQAELVAIAAMTVDIQLAEQGYRGPIDRHVDPAGFVGAAGDGRPIMGLAYAANLRVSTGIEAAEPKALAPLWQAAWTTLAISTQTALSDTSRVAKTVHMAARPKTAWIRMATPPCCARCAILAGKTGSSPRMGFDRHPGCDCDAVPIARYDERRGDPKLKAQVFDVKEYFDSLPPEDQNKIFTKAGAKAIRDGADPAQVVNARRGMSIAADRFGVETTTTLEGTTNRGWASDYLRRSYGRQMAKSPGDRYMRTVRPRLMPEEIYRMAGDDADMALNLLHKNGFLTDASPDLSGKWSWAIRDKDILAAQDRTFQRLVRS